MASISFYALSDDIREVVRFIFEETDLRIFESYSRYDSELREFRSFEELSAAFTLGEDKHGQGMVVSLQLWSPTVMQKLEFERITLNVPGHSFRYCITGAGLIQLSFGGEYKGVITDSHYGHWNEAGARQRCTYDADAVDWSSLARVSGCIQRRIRNKLAVAKVRSRPILPTAFVALQRGLGLRSATLRFDADSTEIQVSPGAVA
jgi:hypothetical protein